MGSRIRQRLAALTLTGAVFGSSQEEAQRSEEENSRDWAGVDVLEVFQRLSAHHQKDLEAAANPSKHPLRTPRHWL